MSRFTVSEATVIILLLKLTVLLALALAAQPLLRHASAALRHLICASALGGALLLPLTLLVPRHTGIFRIVVPVTATPGASFAPLAHWPVLNVFAALWLTGSTLLLLRIALGYRTLAHLLRDAAQVDEAESVDAFYADVSVPVVSGLLRPVILLPFEAKHWPESQRNAALNHELQHVGRSDLWTLLTGHLACAIYWFHPLVWAVARRMRDEQESACDDAVLASGFDPASYAEALVAAARQITSTSLIGCHMLTTNTLKSRIARLFDSGLARIPSRTSLRAAATASVLTVAVVGMLAAQDQIYKVGDGVSTPRVLTKVDPDYPPEARAEKVSGTVTLTVVIGIDGHARDITVTKGLGSGLDEKAVEALQQWLFQPGMKDGAPVQVRATIEINFRLK